jgi:hypothetical protein
MVSGIYNVNDKTINEKLIGNLVERSACSLIEALYCHLSEGAEENKETFDSVQLCHLHALTTARNITTFHL